MLCEGLNRQDYCCYPLLWLEKPLSVNSLDPSYLFCHSPLEEKEGWGKELSPNWSSVADDNFLGFYNITTLLLSILFIFNTYLVQVMPRVSDRTNPPTHNCQHQVRNSSSLERKDHANTERKNPMSRDLVTSQWEMVSLNSLLFLATSQNTAHSENVLK